MLKQYWAKAEGVYCRQNVLINQASVIIPATGQANLTRFLSLIGFKTHTLTITFTGGSVITDFSLSMKCFQASDTFITQQLYNNYVSPTGAALTLCFGLNGQVLPGQIFEKVMLIGSTLDATTIQIDEITILSVA